jgi:hypothetical protein
MQFMNHSIASAIHYCTNEYRFIRKLIEEVQKFSQLILIPVCDHFFNGEKENRALLDRTYQEFPDCQFIEFAYYPDRLYDRSLTGYTIQSREWGKLWHATSRYIAAQFIPREMEYILFIDSDEIIEGDRFLKWLDQGLYQSFEALRLAGYIYSTQARFRADKLVNTALMVRQETLDISKMIHPNERQRIFNISPNPKTALFDGDGTPFVHHYSWVRTKEECSRKIQTWGHRLDQDWNPVIRNLFENPEEICNTFDFSLEEVEPYFDPLCVPIPQDKPSVTSFANVRKINESMIFRREISRLNYAID